eukprot:6480534-Amphidinium_carterae.1
MAIETRGQQLEARMMLSPSRTLHAMENLLPKEAKLSPHHERSQAYEKRAGSSAWSKLGDKNYKRMSLSMHTAKAATAWSPRVCPALYSPTSNATLARVACPDAVQRLGSLPGGCVPLHT